MGVGIFWTEWEGRTNLSLRENTNSQLNEHPSSPLGLKTDRIGNKVFFKWDRSSDDFTRNEGLTYNLFLRLKDSPKYIINPYANTSNGYRYDNSVYNAISDTNWIINDLIPGEYIWGVQAIDNSGRYSDFSKSDTFSLEPEYVKKYKTNDVFNPDVLTHQKWADIDSDNVMESHNFQVQAYDGSFSKVYDTEYGWLIVSPINTVLSDRNLLNGQDLGLEHAAADMGDFDNDGDYDLIIVGKQDAQNICLIIENLGSNEFNIFDSLDIGYFEGDVKWIDIDNDFDLDILISGNTEVGARR